MTERPNIWSYELEKAKHIAGGQMLLSEPFMLDENFRRTVVLLCDHNDETGTVGLIINRPIQLRMRDVIDDFPEFKAQLHLGGPVGTDTLQFIHRLDTVLEGSVQLGKKLFWGGNFEQLKQLIAEGKVKTTDVRFFLGYSGWGVGQLVEEMQENSWILSPAQHGDVFDVPMDALWKHIMVRMGGVYETMASYPENPILN